MENYYNDRKFVGYCKEGKGKILETEFGAGVFRSGFRPILIDIIIDSNRESQQSVGRQIYAIVRRERLFTARRKQKNGCQKKRKNVIVSFHGLN